MSAMQLVGQGGYDPLVSCDDVSVPTVRPRNLLVKVLAAAVTNTDVSHRIEWAKSRGRSRWHLKQNCSSRWLLTPVIVHTRCVILNVRQVEYRSLFTMPTNTEISGRSFMNADKHQ
jgi:hypothetical protein